MTEHDPRDDYDDILDMGPQAPASLVRWPASMMWVFGLLQFIITQLWIAFLITVIVFTHFVDDNKTLSEFWNSVKDASNFWLSVLVWPLASACTLLLMRAANELKRFRHYQLVVAGAILTVLSVPFIFLGVFQVPLGVWLIVLLLRRDVRAHFEAVARAGRGVPLPTDTPTRL